MKTFVQKTIDNNQHFSWKFDISEICNDWYNFKIYQITIIINMIVVPIDIVLIEVQLFIVEISYTKFYMTDFFCLNDFLTWNWDNLEINGN